VILVKELGTLSTEEEKKASSSYWGSKRISLITNGKRDEATQTN
jgi:hypothetical protein